jgi:two-component system chemotaxis response regulator CheB
MPSAGSPPIRVLIADDAVVVRHLLTSVINDDPDLVVVSVARNGAIAVARFEQIRPDVVTLDVDMPEMDGLQALAAIRKIDRDVPIIMFSTLTERGGEATLDALSLGASDYVTKPSSAGGVAAAMERVRDELIPRIKALCAHPLPGTETTTKPPPKPAISRTATERPSNRADDGVIEGVIHPAAADHVKPSADLSRPVANRSSWAPPTGVIDVLAVGASTGGPVALSSLLESLPADFRVPIVITQHMPTVFTRLLAKRLDGSAAIRVREAEDGDELEPGLALIAPGDYHMVLERGLTRVTVRLDQGDPVNYCRPSVDVMFRSVVDVYGGHALGVMLTGMGRDGRDGCRGLKARGGFIIAQDEASSVVWGMPGAVVNAGLADLVLGINSIGPKIAGLVAAQPSSVGRSR